MSIQQAEPQPLVTGCGWQLPHFALLVLFTGLLSAHPVPSVNDLYYLLRLETAWKSTPFGSDWLLSSPSPEHFIFNAVFGLVPLILPIEVTGWLGRVLCWVTTMIVISNLGRHFRLPRWYTTASILLWLASGQSLVGGEWIVQGFEAKSVAYILLFVALDLFLRQRLVPAAALLGLSLSFHPGVGLWASIAVALGMISARLATVKQVAMVAAIALCTALPGIVPLVLQGSEIEGVSASDWEYIVTILMPSHLDPLSWTRRDILSLYAIYIFNFAHALRNRQDATIRFLAGFEFALCVVFTLGLACRAFGYLEFLKLMPFRHFPAFALLLFYFHLSRAYLDIRLHPESPVLAIIGVLALTTLPNVFGVAFDRLSQIRQAWAAQQIDVAPCLEWIRSNSAPDAIVVAPPWIRSTWWIARRAQVVNYYYLPYHRIGEWRKRMEALGGKLELSRRTHAEHVDLLEKNYRALSMEQLKSISSRYGASLFVTDSNYSLPLAYESGGYRVYRLVQTD